MSAKRKTRQIRGKSHRHRRARLVKSEGERAETGSGEGDRWEEVSRRIPLGERLPSNPEIVTEEQLAQTHEAEESREPDLETAFEPSEEDGA